MQYRTLFLAFSIAAATGLAAQAKEGKVNIPFDKEHFTDGAELKKALAAIKKGDAFVQKGGLDQPTAEASYEEARNLNLNNAELELKMAICKLNGPVPSSALPYVQRAAELDPYLNRVHYLLGYALQLNAKWDEAVAEFKRHGEIIRRTPDPDRTYNMVDKHIAECNYGKTYMAAPTTAKVTNAGSVINTAGSEYGVLVDQAGHMYFTSRRAGTTGGKINKVTNNWFEDIYSSSWGANGWAIPQQLPTPINSSRNDATVSISADGKEMVIYRDEENGGDLHTCSSTGGGWSEPKALSSAVNSPAQESSAWRSADGKWLYFVSSRDGGLGGSDIYRSPWDDGLGEWGTAQNLGPDVNSPYDEDGVCMSTDGKTLYFASQGHSTMGGYDLFKSTITDGTWSRPQNLGWPINSPGDDQFLMLSADGTSGYFNSVRPGGMGEDDIYRVEFPQGVKVDETAMLVSMGNAVPMTANEEQLRLTGFIKGLKLMEPLDAKIELMDLRDPGFKASFNTDPATGEFTAVVPAGKEYALNVSSEGYLLHSERLDSDEATGELRINMDLKRLDPGNTEVMRNILFERNSHELDPSSTKELQILTEFLKANPALQIEIAGHTDIDVGHVPNQQLSEARAYVVLNWLVAHGVSPDRLEAKGYGAAQPIAPNGTPEDKALNRRTEIRVL